MGFDLGWYAFRLRFSQDELVSTFTLIRCPFATPLINNVARLIETHPITASRFILINVCLLFAFCELVRIR